MISRRQFVQGAGVAGLGLLAGCGRLPGQAPPQSAYRVGFLSVGRDALDLFREALREQGYL
jgi:hypothetical protein